jgi:hypothetical protein
MSAPKTIRRLLLVAVPVALLAVWVWAGSSSTNLPNGASLAVSIDDPVTSTEFIVPHDAATIDVDVTGTASVGLGPPDATNRLCYGFFRQHRRLRWCVRHCPPV